MIMVKRITQPPKLSWLLWDTAMPDLQIAAHLCPQEYEQALAEGGPNKAGEAAREALRLGELRLMEFQQQLRDL